jgi:hypothetical protein
MSPAAGDICILSSIWEKWQKVKKASNKATF